jgi:hypothetical protein
MLLANCAIIVSDKAAAVASSVSRGISICRRNMILLYPISTVCQDQSAKSLFLNLSVILSRKVLNSPSPSDSSSLGSAILIIPR